MRRTIGLTLALALTGMIASACATSVPAPQSAPESSPSFAARDAEIMAVLDRYMDALNALDLEGHLATYHFPHYRHASGEITIWETARDVTPLSNVPEAERRVHLRSVLEPDWHKSEWTRRDIVQGDGQKVHVVTRFERRRQDDSVITAYDSLYIMTREENGWGIKGRSSFAP